MTSITTGTGLGLFNTATNVLGTNYTGGNALPGRAGQSDAVTVNSLTGNLIVQRQDEYIPTEGLDLNLVRTYNSQGLLDGDNNDNWRLNVYRRLTNEVGPRNTAGAKITRVGADGAESIFNYDTTLGLYRSTDGDGAHDTLQFNSTTSVWTYTDGSRRTTETFNLAGQLLSAADPDGNTTIYNYTPAGLVSQIRQTTTQGTTLILGLDYNASNQLTQVRYGSVSGTTETTYQTRVHYTYDSQNRLEKVIVDLSPADSLIADGKTVTTTYTYDGTSKRLASITQGDGTRLGITYVLVGTTYKVYTLTDGVGRVTRFTYVSASQTDVTDPLGYATSYRYDTANRLAEVLSPAVNGSPLSTKYGYDTDNNLTQVTDPQGNAVVYQYDSNGNQLLVRDVLGNTITRTYSATNQLLTESVYVTPDQDGAGPLLPGNPQTTRYAYDSENHLRFIVSPEGRVTEYQYTAVGERQAAIQYAGAVYTVTGLAITASLAEATLVAWTTTQDKTQTLRTDYTFDFHGLIATQTTYAKVDALGVGVRDGSAAATWTLYNTNGDRFLSQDAKGNFTIESFDGLGRRTTFSNNTTGQTTQTNFDDANNRIVTTLADGLVVTAVYNAAGELVSRLEGSTTATLSTTTYTYDADGRLRHTTDSLGQRTYALYDEAGRPIASIDAAGALTETVYTQNGQVAKTIRYATRLTGAQLTSLVNADGTPANVTLTTLRPSTDTIVNPNALNDRTTYRVYDNANRLVYQIDEDRYVTETLYDGVSRVTDVIRHSVALASVPAGSLTPASIVVTPDVTNDRRTRYFYDAEGRTIGVLDAEGYLSENQFNAGGQLVTGVRYARAATVITNGVVDSTATNTLRTTGTFAALKQNITNAGPNIADQTERTFYNARNKVIGTLDAEGYLTEYTYDKNGNRTQVKRWANRANTYTPGASVESLRPAASLPTDPAQDQVSRATYDGANRLESETDAQGSVTVYQYDLGDRVVKIIRGMETITDPANITQTYLDSAQRVGIVANGQLTTYEYDASGYIVRERLHTSPAQAANWSQDFSANATGLSTLTSPYLAVANQRLEVRTQNTATTTTVSTTGTRSYATSQNMIFRADVTTSAASTGRYLSIGAQGNASNKALTALFDGDKLYAAWYDAGGVYHTQLLSSVTKPLKNYTAYVVDVTTSAYGASLRVYERGKDATTGYSYYLSTTTWGTATFLLQTQGSAGRAVTTSYVDNISESTIRGQLLPGGLVATESFTDTLKSYVYNDATYAVLGRTLADSRITTYRYDPQGRLTGELSGIGSGYLDAYTNSNSAPDQAAMDSYWNAYGVKYTYDADGRRTSTTDQLGHTTYFYYDADNRLRYTITPGYADGDTVKLGEVREHVYNAFSQETDTTRYAGRIDTLNLTGGVITQALTDRIAAITNASKDARTQTVFNLRGAIKQILDAEGKSTTFGTNAFGERRSINQSIDATTTLATSYGFDRRGLALNEFQIGGGSFRVGFFNTYDAFGRLTSSMNSNGNTTTYDYDRLGRTVTVTDALTHARRSTYDAFGRVYTQTDALNQTTRYTYNETDRSVTITTPEGVSTTTQRNRLGDTVSVSDGRGNVATFTYDKNGNLTNERKGGGNVTNYWYDQANRLQMAYNNDFRTTSYTYDAANRILTRTQDAWGVPLTTTYTYDALGRTATVIDPRGIVTRTEYDRKGQVKRVTVDPSDAAQGYTGLNLVTDYTYDNVGHTLTVVVGSGTADARTTQYLYDGFGRRTQQIVDPTGLKLTTRYIYDYNDNLVTKTDAVGTPELRQTRFVYDANERLLYQIDAAGAVVKTEYDDAGRVTATRAYATVIALTGLGTQVYEADLTPLLQPNTAADRVTRYAYDKDGRLAFTTDALQHVTENVYDKSGNVIQRIAFATALPVTNGTTVDAIRAFYANTANQTAQDPITRMAYDALNRAVYQIDALGNVTQMAYDKSGNAIKTTAYATSLTAANLTALDSVVDATSATERVTFITNTRVLDPVNDRTSRTVYDGANRAAYSIDALGYVKETVYDPDGNIKETIAYYDAIATATLSASPYIYEIIDALAARTATQPAKDQHTQYVYDKAGRLTTQLHAVGTLEQYSDSTTYDATGLITSHTDGNLHTTYYAYDTAGRERRRIDGIGYVVDTTYDALGNTKTETTYMNKVALPVTTDALWGYHAQNPTPNTDLVSGDRTTTYAYDKVGRLQLKTGPSINGLPGVNTYYTRDAFGSITYTFEAVGLPEQRITRSVYNTLGQLTEQTTALYAPEAATTRFGYDAFGNQTAYLDPRGVELAETDTDWAKAERLRLGNTTGTGATLRAKLASELTSAEKIALRLLYTTTQVFDKLNRKTQVTDALGNITKTEYDRFGNIVKAIDPSNNVGYFYYDAHNRITLQVDPEGYATRMAYDANGNASVTIKYANKVQGSYTQTSQIQILVSAPTVAPTGPYLVADALRDQYTRAEYDALNRTSKITDAEGYYFETFQYDALGNVKVHVDKNGNTFRYSYDVNGKKIAEYLPTTYSGTDVAPSTIDSASGSSNAAQVAYDRQGNAIAVWSQTDGATNNIYVNRYNGTTGTWGGAQLLESGSGSADNPQVAIDNQGNAMAVWTQSDGVTNNIYARRFTIATGTWGIAQLIESGVGYADSPQVGVDNQGNAMAVWAQNDGVTNNIYANRYNVATGTWGTAQLIETGIGYAAGQRIAVDTLGNAMAVWSQADGATTNLYANRYNVATGTWGTAQLIETGIGYPFGQQIAVDNAGNAMAVWSQVDGSTINLYANRYNVVTGTWGTAQLIESGGDAANSVQIAIDAQGNAIAVWTQSDGYSYSLYANRYNVTTGAWGVAQLLETGGGNTGSPQIAIDKYGNAVAVWITTYGANYSSIYANHYSAATDTWGTAQLIESPGAVYGEQIAVDTQGNAMMTWVQFGAARNVLNAKKFSFSQVVNQYEYDAVGNKTKSIEAAGLTEQRVTQYVYDKNNRQTQKIGALVEIYDPVTQTRSSVTPKVALAYDAHGNVSKETDANGNSTYYYYDANNRRSAMVDGERYLHRFFYDAVGNKITERVYGDKIPNTVSLAALPNPASITGMDAGNYRETASRYDANNRLVESKTRDVLVYDRVNGVLTRSLVTTTQYDKNGNVTLTIDPNGSRTISYYDKAGHRVAQVDPLGYLTWYEYDGNGNVVKLSRYATALGAGTMALLSVNSNSTILKNEVVSAANPADRITTYTYDRLNRKTTESLANLSYASVDSSSGVFAETQNASATISYSYDGLGNLMEMIAPDTSRVDYVYDSLGRRTGTQDAAYLDYQGSSVRQTTSITYDGLGNKTSESRIAKSVSDSQTHRYFYDAAGRLIRDIDPANVEIRYEYDANGNVVLKHENRTNAGNVTTAIQTQYLYDRLNRQTTTVDAENIAHGVTYDAFGDIVRRSINGADHEINVYDDAGRLVRTNVDDGVYRAYLYDANGNATAKIQSAEQDVDLNPFTTARVPYTLSEIAGLAVTLVQRTESVFDARNQLVETDLAPMQFLSSPGQTQEVWVDTKDNPFLGGTIRVQVPKVGAPANLDFDTGHRDAESLQLWLWPVGGTKTTAVSIPKWIPGHFVYSWAQLPAGSYEYEYKVLDVNTKVLDYIKGRLTVPTQSTPYLEPDQLLSDPTHFALLPTTAADAKGNMLLVWFESDAPAGTFAHASMKARRFVPGQGWQPTIVIGDVWNSNVGARFPQVTMSADGSAVVTWPQQQISGLFTIMASRYDGLTGTWSVPQSVSVADSGNVDIASSAIDSLGNIYVTWAQLYGTGAATTSVVYSNRFDKASGLWSGPRALSGVISGRSVFPSIDVDAHGNAMAVWANSGIYAARYAAAKGEWQAANIIPGSLNTWATTTKVAMSQDGDAVVLWENGSVNAASYDTFSNTWGAIQTLNSTGSTADLVLAKDSKGNVAITYAFTAFGSSVTNIYANLYDSGSRVWQLARLISTEGGNNFNGGVTLFENGTVMANWRHEVSGTSFVMNTNRYVPNYSWETSTTLATNVASTPTIAYDGMGNALIAYPANNATSGFEIRAARYVVPSPVIQTMLQQQFVTLANTSVLPSSIANTIVRSQVFDAFGEVVKEIDGRGNGLATSDADWARTERLARGFAANVASLTETDKATLRDFYATKSSYSTRGQLVSKQDPMTTSTLADGTVTLPQRPTTYYYYDDMGRLLGSRDPNGNLNVQALNAMGMVIAEFHADSGVKRSYYDEFGNRRIVKDEMGDQTYYTYDKVNRLRRVDHPTDLAYRSALFPNGYAPRFDTYEYDEAGQRIKHTTALSVSDPSSTTESTYYDNIGRVTKTVTLAGVVTNYSYTLDALSGATTFVTTTGDGKTLADTKDYFGRLVQHKDMGNRIFSYQYNQAGWLIHQQGNNGQNIDYTYYHNGYRKSVVDNGIKSLAEYEYDVNGNRTGERYAQRSVDTQQWYYTQWSSAKYDELNRVKEVTDPRYTVTYEYDAAGNRRHVLATYYDGLGAVEQRQSYWYAYDSMNRFKVTKGALSGVAGSGATIVAGPDGYAIGYDLAGRRTSANNETYIYAADGLLYQTKINNVLRAQRLYDTSGNVTRYTEYDATGAETNRIDYTYSADGRVKTEVTSNKTSTYTYDLAGNLDNVVSSQAGANTTTRYVYDYWDSAKQFQIKIQGQTAQYASYWAPGFSYFNYDVNGHLTKVSDIAGNRYLSYQLNHDGAIVQRNETIQGYTSRTQTYYYLNGIGIGDAGGFGASRADYTTLLAARNQPADKSGAAVSSADFDYNYTPINDSYPATTPGTYTVQAFDTFQSVAQAVWGDSSLWYLIADANGLQDSTKLLAGQRLVIPNVVTNIHNNTSTFKVYNPGAILGDTSPTLPDAPPPPVAPNAGGGGGCGVIGMIIMVIVAIIVTIYTAGAAATLFSAVGTAGTTVGTTALGTWAAGTAALSGGLGWAGVAGAMIGGAVGSAASQLTGMATGNVDKFSWGAVASGALGAGLTAGVGVFLNGGALSSLAGYEPSTWQGQAINAGLNNIANQGINILTGQQEHFSWGSVATSAIAAPLTTMVDQAFGAPDSTVIGGGSSAISISKSIGGQQFTVGNLGRAMGAELTKSAVQQLTRIAVDGKGRVNWAQVSTDGFGNAIGNSIADQMKYGEATRSWEKAQAIQKWADNEFAAWDRDMAKIEQDQWAQREFDRWDKEVAGLPSRSGTAPVRAVKSPASGSGAGNDVAELSNGYISARNQQDMPYPESDARSVALNREYTHHTSGMQPDPIIPRDGLAGNVAGGVAGVGRFLGGTIMAIKDLAVNTYQTVDYALTGDPASRPGYESYQRIGDSAISLGSDTLDFYGYMATGDEKFRQGVTNSAARREAIVAGVQNYLQVYNTADDYEKSAMISNAVMTIGSLFAGTTGSRVVGEVADKVIPGFSTVESGVIREAQGILGSSELGQIRTAHLAGEPVSVNVGGRLIQYEPSLPASGMTMFGENGFLIGREAFTSPAELQKTVLHELYRLNTSTSATGVSAALAAQETKAAFDFAARAVKHVGGN